MKRKWIQRASAWTLALALSLSLWCIPTSAQETYQQSGSLDMAKLSKKEIAALLEDAPVALPSQVYEEQPSLVAPYASGKLTIQAQQAATDRLNALRRLAGLPAVELDTSLSDNAQYGAVLLAVSEFGHYPSQPADMDDAFYQQGLQATSSSNIAMGTDLVWSVDMFMYDSDSNNVGALGHRRWQLNPTLGKVGFGMVEIPFLPFYSIPYVTEKVFDESGPGCDYDFIAWPASGYFPVEEDNDQGNVALFSPLSAWSITVDTAQYGTPSLDRVQVKLTRESDGRVWEFSKEDNDFNYDYFNVENSGYGVPNCILFRPDGIDGYNGLYTVEVTGLARPLSYQVNFFPVAEADRPDPSKYFTDVTTADWYLNAVEYVYEQGIMSGKGSGLFQPTVNLTRAEAAQLFYNLESQPSVTGESVYTDVNPGDWWYNAVTWATQNGIASGMGGGWFNAAGNITREQFAVMLYKYAAYKGYDVSDQADLSTYTDSNSISTWALEAFQWANAMGLINGDDKRALSPQGNTSRAQAASILMNYDKNVAG